MITVWVLHHHRYSTKILIIYYEAENHTSNLGTQGIGIWRVATASDKLNAAKICGNKFP